ncbi:hypothetical protein GCM10009738_11160 [Kitasatospora viridis]
MPVVDAVQPRGPGEVEQADGDGHGWRGVLAFRYGWFGRLEDPEFADAGAWAAVHLVDRLPSWGLVLAWGILPTPWNSHQNKTRSWDRPPRRKPLSWDLGRCCGHLETPNPRNAIEPASA